MKHPQNSRRRRHGAALTLAGWLLGTALSACTASDAPVPAATHADAPAAAAEAASGGAASDWTAALAEHMPYAAFRALALDNGWTPEPSPSCMQDVIGADHQAQCAGENAPAQCTLCAELPELEACSGDGYCSMRFTRPGTGARLDASTYGPIEAWREDEARVLLIDWSRNDPAAAAGTREDAADSSGR